MNNIDNNNDNDNSNNSNNSNNNNDVGKNMSRCRRSGRFESGLQQSGMEWARAYGDLVVDDEGGDEGALIAANRRA